MKKESRSHAPAEARYALKVPPRKPSIDYPFENEAIEGDSYTVRINAPAARMVRLAIDQGDWRECRPALGYWWFDWSDFAPGEHEVIVCAEYEDGREAVSFPSHCLVKGR